MIQQYVHKLSIFSGARSMVADVEGGWVRHADHIAAMAEAHYDVQWRK